MNRIELKQIIDEEIKIAIKRYLNLHPILQEIYTHSQVSSSNGSGFLHESAVYLGEKINVLSIDFTWFDLGNEECIRQSLSGSIINYIASIFEQLENIVIKKLQNADRQYNIENTCFVNLWFNKDYKFNIEIAEELNADYQLNFAIQTSVFVFVS